jgi:uncharacterized SAM-binding protein YcdF (DUF218 family)
MNPGYDAAVILGGGRYDENTLTPLSIKRLDKGLELYQKGLFPKILLPGGKYSTYSPNAIEFDKTTAQLRKEYLLSLGNIKEEDILLVEDGRDTIYEALAVRKKSNELDYKTLLLITSEKHMPRALYIFRRIFGDDIQIDDGDGLGQVNTGDILLDAEEKEYLSAVKDLFSNKPNDIPDPKSWDEWYLQNKSLYDEFKIIHDKFHPPGKESQAYAGVNK